MIQLSNKIVKAKKVHFCQLCGSRIEKDQKYVYQFNKINDDAYAFKNHIHCGEIANKLKMYDECDEGLNDDAFQEHIKEEYIRLMEIHNYDVYNYEHFVSPPFDDRLKYVCEMHKIEII